MDQCLSERGLSGSWVSEGTFNAAPFFMAKLEIPELMLRSLRADTGSRSVGT